MSNTLLRFNLRTLQYCALTTLLATTCASRTAIATPALEDKQTRRTCHTDALRLSSEHTPAQQSWWHSALQHSHTAVNTACRPVQWLLRNPLKAFVWVATSLAHSASAAPAHTTTANPTLHFAEPLRPVRCEAGYYLSAEGVRFREFMLQCPERTRAIQDGKRNCYDPSVIDKLACTLYPGSMNQEPKHPPQPRTTTRPRPFRQPLRIRVHPGRGKGWTRHRHSHAHQRRPVRILGRTSH